MNQLLRKSFKTLNSLALYCFPAVVAGVPGLEPRLTEPESVGLPITPYPITTMGEDTLP